MNNNHRRKRSACSNYRPLSDLPYSQNYNYPSCSHCIYFSSKNCHKSSRDDLTSDFDIV